MNGPQMEDQLNLYGQSFSSRLLLGTARYDSPSLFADAISAAAPAMLTVSLRRQISGSKESGQSFWDLVRESQRAILPNTAGCFSAREAVKTACMARELFETNFVKLEVIGDELNLQPDPFGLVEAAVELVKLGFYVLPYCTEDWILCRRLIDAGCMVLMPWAAPIGTGQGPRNRHALRELRERAPTDHTYRRRGYRSSVSRVSGDGVGIRRRTAKHSCIARSRSGSDGECLCHRYQGRPRRFSRWANERAGNRCCEHARNRSSFHVRFTPLRYPAH